MFIGHFAVGFAGKRAAAGPSLGTWFLATQWLDLIWPVFLLLGWEQVRIAPGDTAVTPLEFVYYPFTHSLVGALAWAVGFALVYRLITGQGRVAAWLGLGVFSHWVLDFISHRPDLPLYPDSEIKLGLDLWASLWATVLVEGALYAAGVYLYLRAFPGRDRVGTYGAWALVTFLVLVYLGNLFGPPPPSVTAIAVGALAMWLLVAWGYWIDRHRGAA